MNENRTAIEEIAENERLTNENAQYVREMITGEAVWALKYMAFLATAMTAIYVLMLIF